MPIHEVIHQKPIVIDLFEDQKIAEFLNSKTTKTREVYTTYFSHIKEFFQLSGSEMLKQRKTVERRLLEFANWLTDQGYSTYTIESTIGSLRGFYQHFRCPLYLTPQEKRRVGRRTRTSEDYILTQDDLYKMFLVGSAKARMCIALEASIGQRVEDFTEISFAQLRAIDLNQPIPIYAFTIHTQKEAIDAHCFLTEQARDSIKEFLAENTDKADSEKIWTSKSYLLSKMVRRLADKANVDYHGKRLVFHCIRKFTYNALCRAMSQPKANLIIGKSESEKAYVSTDDLRECFSEALPYLSLGNGTVIKKRVSNLEDQLKEKDARIKELEAQLAQYQDVTKILAKKELENRPIEFHFMETEETEKREEEYRILRKFVNGK